MKCEIVAALLLRTQMLFLDEPTLGLDVTAERRIRAFILAYGERFGATVLLTSHYMADVEALTRRVIVIHHGRLLFDGGLAALVERFSPDKIIVVDLETPADLSRYGEVFAADECRVTLRVPKAEAPSVTGAPAGRPPGRRSDHRRSRRRRGHRPCLPAGAGRRTRFRAGAGVSAAGDLLDHLPARVRDDDRRHVSVPRRSGPLATPSAPGAGDIPRRLDDRRPLLGGEVDGFGAGGFAAYFLAAMVVNHATFTWIMWEFEYRIRNGKLSPLLLRPIHPIHRDIANNLTFKLLTLAVVLPVAAVLALLFRPASP